MKNICISILAVSAIILFVKGCDSVNGPDSNETGLLHSFSYEIYDNNGALITNISHEKIGESGITASAGLFGNEFLPPWLLEGISEKTGLDPDELKKHEIYLHAETDQDAERNSASLRFSLSSEGHWQTGSYKATEITVEETLTFIETLWQARQNNRPDFSAKTPEFDTNSIEPSGHSVSINYSETGFATETSYGVKIEPDGFQYFVLDGSVNVENVSDDLLEGQFSTKFLGFPMELLYFSDEFPENPGYHIISISGNFTTVHGDYFDLVESATNLFD